MPYRNMVSLRLDDRDLDALEDACERSGLSRSDLLRSLLRVPPGADRQRTVYAVDGRTLGRLATELVRWGRHYNQAVHALNAIAYYLRANDMETSEVVEELSRAERKLAEMQPGVELLRRAVVELSGSVLAGLGR